ncbi:MAG TPA: hypothetical protein VIH54_14225, partial [Chthoniobacterales bacterium]
MVSNRRLWLSLPVEPHICSRNGAVTATEGALLRPHADMPAHRLNQCLLQLIVLCAFLQGFIQFLASFIG